jgi:hypothetical protein
MVREHLHVVLFWLLAHKGGNVHWGIVPAKKPLYCLCRHHPFLLQSLHKSAQDNVGVIDRLAVMTRSTQLVNIAPCWSKNCITIFFAMESWTLVLMDQVIISWSTVWTALPVGWSKTVLIIQQNDLYHSTCTTNSFIWGDYQIFFTEMERMTGIVCQKDNFLANQLSRPERVLSKKGRK